MRSAAGLRHTTSEWTLWVVAVSCALHVAEEYLTGWQEWARQTLGIVMPTATFLVMNTVLVVAALLLARAGWRRPVLSLVIPAATVVNAVFFHILPTIARSRVSPGLYTATFLYLPFSSWALLGAARDGVPRAAIAMALAAGTLMMVSVVLGARWLGNPAAGQGSIVRVMPARGRRARRRARRRPLQVRCSAISAAARSAKVEARRSTLRRTAVPASRWPSRTAGARSGRCARLVTSPR